VGSLCSGVRVKWPNDVHVGGKKICGILCERNGDCVIVGIGVNVNQTVFAPEIADWATSLRMETGVMGDVGKARDAVLSAFAGNIVEWREKGFSSLLSRLTGFDCLKGRLVTVRRTDDDREPASGMCGGIRPDGTLDVAGEAISAGEAHIV
jgi:BirA family biotin operon repressor/biotin-[acetyl-CoA-carboxylase] ligase